MSAEVGVQSCHLTDPEAVAQLEKEKLHIAALAEQLEAASDAFDASYRAPAPGPAEIAATVVTAAAVAASTQQTGVLRPVGEKLLPSSAIIGGSSASPERSVSSPIMSPSTSMVLCPDEEAGHKAGAWWDSLVVSVEHEGPDAEAGHKASVHLTSAPTSPPDGMSFGRPSISSEASNKASIHSTAASTSPPDGMSFGRPSYPSEAGGPTSTETAPATPNNLESNQTSHGGDAAVANQADGDETDGAPGLQRKLSMLTAASRLLHGKIEAGIQNPLKAPLLDLASVARIEQECMELRARISKLEAQNRKLMSERQGTSVSKGPRPATMSTPRNSMQSSQVAQTTQRAPAGSPSYATPTCASSSKESVPRQPSSSFPRTPSNTRGRAHTSPSSKPCKSKEASACTTPRTSKVWATPVRPARGGGSTPGFGGGGSASNKFFGEATAESPRWSVAQPRSRRRSASAGDGGAQLASSGQAVARLCGPARTPSTPRGSAGAAQTPSTPKASGANFGTEISLSGLTRAATAGSSGGSVCLGQGGTGPAQFRASKAVQFSGAKVGGGTSASSMTSRPRADTTPSPVRGSAAGSAAGSHANGFDRGFSSPPRGREGTAYPMPAAATSAPCVRGVTPRRAPPEVQAAAVAVIASPVHSTPTKVAGASGVSKAYASGVGQSPRRLASCGTQGVSVTIAVPAMSGGATPGVAAPGVATPFLPSMRPASPPPGSHLRPGALPASAAATATAPCAGVMRLASMGVRQASPPRGSSPAPVSVAIAAPVGHISRSCAVPVAVAAAVAVTPPLPRGMATPPACAARPPSPAPRPQHPQHAMQPRR